MTPAGAPYVLVGVIAVGAILLTVAGRKQWLTPEATPPAIVVGLAVVAGVGAGGGLLLLVFVASTSVLTGFRAARKTDDGREHGTAARGREARQVWANGGVAVFCALSSLLPGMRPLAAGVAGALAAAMADSWATEVGTALRGKTVLVTSFREVIPGTSGGVSIAGTIAGVSGSAVAGSLVAVAPHLWTTPWIPTSATGGPPPWPMSESALAAGVVVTLAGTMGMLIDSILGATVENRLPWMDNEAVNVVATLTGAAVAVLLLRL